MDRFFRVVFLGLTVVMVGAVDRVLAMQSSEPTPVPTSELVFAQRGTLPLIITAPHGGTAPVPGVPERTGVGVRAFETARDTRTRELTESVANRLEARLCQKPYLVIAFFDRKYIDANRVEPEALEHPNARVHYLAYHGTVRSFVDELRLQYPDGSLLLDLHGQSTGPTTIYRGTHNGRTVTGLLARRGTEALIGPTSIFGQLAAGGFDVFPQNTPLRRPPEHGQYFTGYTVRTYGSHQPDGIDAIQIENGNALRQPQNLDRLAQGLADAIGTFAEAHLGVQARCGALP
jgi:hypothetical protein